MRNCLLKPLSTLNYKSKVKNDFSGLKSSNIHSFSHIKCYLNSDKLFHSWLQCDTRSLCIGCKIVILRMPTRSYDQLISNKIYFKIWKNGLLIFWYLKDADVNFIFWKYYKNLWGTIFLYLIFIFHFLGHFFPGKLGQFQPSI